MPERPVANRARGDLAAVSCVDREAQGRDPLLEAQTMFANKPPKKAFQFIHCWLNVRIRPKFQSVDKSHKRPRPSKSSTLSEGGVEEQEGDGSELNNIIRNKDDEITNLKNLVYCHSDDAEKLIKVLQDAYMQLVECATQIHDMATEKELKYKELEELTGAAQVAVDMVDPPKEGVISERMLLERLHEAPQKISGYISEITKLM
ncbi:glutathione S-transferase T3-like [Panicum miliaceum]|uniref:Glutathione S-transferase T3-like n=1 Tax=Panicum miliaceum TaxID=4540 RepID=A0A3L6PS91_PANMI|nr:glutathione S-transferase T3-like [Panicum miliaceum]